MNMSLKQTGVSHPPNTKMLPCITHAECLHKLIKICSSQKETTHITAENSFKTSLSVMMKLMKYYRSQNFADVTLDNCGLL